MLPPAAAQDARAKLSRDLVALLADEHAPALDLLCRCFPPGLLSYLQQRQQPSQARPGARSGAAASSPSAPLLQHPPRAPPPGGGNAGEDRPGPAERRTAEDVPRERAMSPGRAPDPPSSVQKVGPWLVLFCGQEHGQPEKADLRSSTCACTVVHPACMW